MNLHRLTGQDFPFVTASQRQRGDVRFLDRSDGEILYQSSSTNNTPNDVRHFPRQRSSSIPILHSTRPLSEIQLDEDEAAAEYRDYVFCQRMKDGRKNSPTTTTSIARNHDQGMAEPPSASPTTTTSSSSLLRSSMLQSHRMIVQDPQTGQFFYAITAAPLDGSSSSVMPSVTWDDVPSSSSSSLEDDMLFEMEL